MKDDYYRRRCKHCLGVCENEIGELVCSCEIWGDDVGKNMNCGDCFDNCEDEETRLPEWPLDKSCQFCKHYDYGKHHCTLDWVSCLSDENPFNMYEPRNSASTDYLDSCLKSFPNKSDRDMIESSQRELYEP